MMLKQDIIREATRLTRAGRVIEATALLQRMLRSETSPGVTFGTASDIAPARREPPIIDATATIIKETDRPHPRVTSAQSHMLGVKLLRRTKKRTRASRVRLCATIRLTRSASTWPGYRPERPRQLSWERHTTICTRQSAYTLASPVGLPLTFPLRLSPCDKAVSHSFQVRRQADSN
jgi:hypothetical protein